MTYLHDISTPAPPYIIQNKPDLLPTQPGQTNAPEMEFVVKGGMFSKLWHAIPYVWKNTIRKLSGKAQKKKCFWWRSFYFLGNYLQARFKLTEMYTLEWDEKIRFKRLNPNCCFMYHQVSTFTGHLHVLYGSQKKHPLLLHTALIGWLL